MTCVSVLLQLSAVLGSLLARELTMQPSRPATPEQQQGSRNDSASKGRKQPAAGWGGCLPL
jgi:hypothetical protein